MYKRNRKASFLSVLRSLFPRFSPRSCRSDESIEPKAAGDARRPRSWCAARVGGDVANHNQPARARSCPLTKTARTDLTSNVSMSSIPGALEGHQEFCSLLINTLQGRFAPRSSFRFRETLNSNPTLSARSFIINKLRLLTNHTPLSALVSLLEWGTCSFGQSKKGPCKVRDRLTQLIRRFR
jgi:hypothetical protein